MANVSRVPPATAVKNKPNTKEELGHFRRSLWDQGCHLQHNASVMTCLCSTVCEKKMPNVSPPDHFKLQHLLDGQYTAQTHDFQLDFG